MVKISMGKRIRLRFAINRLKKILLPDLHVPGEAQTGFVFEELDSLALKNLISERSWDGWFLEKPPAPQPSSVSALDWYAQRCLQERGSAESMGAAMPVNYFSAMVRGGLMAAMTEATKSKDVSLVLISRAQGYKPLTPMHLHFDAMDAAAWSKDFVGVSWSVVATIAGERILQLLHQRWGPRSGSLYPTLRSDFAIQWDEANQEERVKMKKNCARYTPNLFQHWIKPGANPTWAKVGCESDISEKHIYKLLFALAADTEFLVRERLEAWTLDLATAALAMHASAWTDRYNTMSLGCPAELRYWAAFHEIFFRTNVEEIDAFSIESVMDSWPAEWEEVSVAAFAEARRRYAAILVDGGVSPTEVFEVAMMARQQHPLVYVA